jgi:predicted PilT family ATPase
MTDQWSADETMDQQFLRLASVVARRLSEMRRDPEAVLDVHLDERKLRLLVNGSVDEWRVSRIADENLAQEFDMEGAAEDIIADWETARPRMEH